MRKEIVGILLALVLVVGLSLVTAPPVLAETKTSTGTGGNWNTAGTWSPSGVPASTDNVIIAAGTTVTISAGATPTCGDIKITGALTFGGDLAILYVRGNGTSPVTTGAVSGGGTINGVSSGGCDIKLYGNWSFNGAINNRLSVTFQGPNDATVSAVSANPFRHIYCEKDPGTTIYFNVTPTYGQGGTGVPHMNSGNIYYNGGAQIVLPATYPANLTIAGSGVKTMTSVTVNGVFSVEGTATASVAPTYGAAATLRYNTATARTTGAEWITPFAATGGVIIANTGTITLNAAKTFSTGVPLTINSGATLSTNSTSNYGLTFGGDYINNGGALSAGSSAITITGTATQSIAGFTTTGTVSMTKTGGTATFTGNVNGGALTISGSGGTLNLGSGLTHNFTGTWTRTAGTLAGNSSTLNLGGALSGTGGTFTASTGTVNYYGAAQSIAAVTYNNLIINQSSGSATLGGSITVNGVLTLTNGNVNTGSNTVIIPASGSVSRTSGHIIGNLQKNVATGSGVSRTFEVGTASGYDPIVVNFGSVSVAGNLIAEATAGEHPSIGTSTINSTKDVNVYWSFTNSGITFDNYGATFNFNNPGDIDGSANTANFIVGKYDAGWTYPTVGTKTSTSTQATGVTSLSDFVLGEVAAPTVTAISPNAGPTAGGTSVNITGTNFISGATVTIGGGTATGVTVVNSTAITATTPAGTAGAKDVVVTTAGGSGNLTGGYTYAAAPTVTAISPSSGPTVGGTSVNITGTDFISGATVTIGGSATTGVTVVNSTRITATTPAGTPGAKDVIVTTVGGNGTLAGGYTYNVVTQVTFRSFSNSTGADSTSCVIPKPLGLQVGDLMIAQVVGTDPRTTSGDIGAFTAPSGWTSIRQDTAIYSSSYEYLASALFWKIADASDVAASSFTFTVTSATSNRGTITAWYGHNPTSPINAQAGQPNNTASTTVTSPGITPSVANCTILLFCGIYDDNTQSGYTIVTSPPPSWTEAYDLPSDLSYDLGLSIAYGIRSATGATGLGTATTSGSDYNTGQLVAIAPDVTAPTVTINQAAGQADPTLTCSGQPINFTVVFSERVLGFATGDVTLSGTAVATSAIVTETAPNDGTTYNVAVSGWTGLGTVIATIGAGKATDLVGNNNNASTSTDNTVTVSASGSSGPRNGSTAADDSSVGTVTWSSPSSALTQDDAYATATLDSASETTHYLKATNFGFSIPSGVEIKGILVEVERFESGTTLRVFDNSIKLVKGGTISGTDKSTGLSWPSGDTDTYQPYGNSTDLWGLNWTPSDINSSTFGAVISAIHDTGTTSRTASVDHIRITVYYSCPSCVSPVAAFNGTPTSGCAPLTVNFTDQSTGSPTSWSWNFGDGGNSTAQNVSHQYTNAGTYNVTLTVSNACGNNTLAKSNYITVYALPTATPSSDSPVCEGATIHLTGGPGGMTYSWTGPNSFTSSNQSPTISGATLAMAGAYNLTVTNSTTGCTSNPATTTVVVNAKPTVSATNNGPVCEGGTIQLTGGPSGAYTYSWSGPNGYSNTTQSPTVSTNATLVMAGTYTLTVTNSTSGCSASNSTSVTVNAKPAATASTSTPSVCEGGTIQLTGGPSGAYTYSWSGPNGYSNTTQSPTVSTNATLVMAGTYTLTVTNSTSGCSASNSTNVVVNAKPAATASNNGPVCEGSTIILTGGPGGMSTYNWTGPNSFSSSLQSPTVTTNATLAMAGTYTLTVTNSNGCTGTNSTSVFVEDCPADYYTNWTAYCNDTSIWRTRDFHDYYCLNGT
jgi:hypothetical protein